MLAEDCSFVPVQPRTGRSDGIAFESSRPADLFACDLGYEQSCNPDPCNAPQSTCEGGCEKAKDPDACREGCAARVAPGEKACRAKCDELRDPGAIATCHVKSCSAARGRGRPRPLRRHARSSCAEERWSAGTKAGGATRPRGTPS